MPKQGWVDIKYDTLLRISQELENKNYGIVDEIVNRILRDMGDYQ